MLADDIGRAIEDARKRVGLSLDDLADSTSLDVALLGSMATMTPSVAAEPRYEELQKHKGLRLSVIDPTMALPK